MDGHPNDQPLLSSTADEDVANFVSLSYSHQDPLGLNDLADTAVPTYSYSLDDGLHNFIIPVTSATNSSHFVVSGQSFSLAPLVRLDHADPSTSSNEVDQPKSYTLVPSEKSSKTSTKLSKETRTTTALKNIKSVGHDSDDNLNLQCEWEDCTLLFTELNPFLDHVAYHVTDVPIISTKVACDSTNQDGIKDLIDDADGQKTFGCLWQGCGFETMSSGEMIRHLNFHSFHTKIKCHGNMILEETQIKPCSLPRDQRNVLPQLPECDFQCQWEGCERDQEVFSEPIKFYWHVQWHAEEYRPRRVAFGKSSVKEKREILCKWSNCSFKAATTFKLKDHLKSHSAERVVACPNCGGLFANRSKFHDHCQRQLKVEKGGLKCSYCQKKFPTERLLRDHMRSHINHFQCPLCNMTCPSATAMNKHITYRHSEERAFPCPFQDEDDEVCDYIAKTENDLNKHMRLVHYGGNDFKCDNEGCTKSFKSRTALRFHIEKDHENQGPKYCCHLCKKRFRRGNYLTSHLATIHDYKWPTGHKKFYYAMDENGLYHVQTMRFESFELVSNAYDEAEEATFP